MDTSDPLSKIKEVFLEEERRWPDPKISDVLKKGKKGSSSSCSDLTMGITYPVCGHKAGHFPIVYFNFMCTAL